MGVAGIGGVLLAACGSSATTSGPTASATASAASGGGTGADCVTIHELTASQGEDLHRALGTVVRTAR